MFKFRQLKIRARLIVIFCCFTAVIALQGYVGIYHIDDMSRLFDGMYQDNLLPLNELRNIETEVNNIRINTYRYLGSADPDKMAKAKQMLMINQMAVHKKFQEHSEEFQQLRKLFLENTYITQEIMDLHYNFNTREAYQLMNERGQKSYDELIALVNRFTHDKTLLAQSNLHAGHLIQRSNVYVMVGVISLSILLTVIIGFVFAKYLTKPIYNITSSFKQLGTGLPTSQIDDSTLRRNDEFGEMAQSYEKTRIKLNELIANLKKTNEELSDAKDAAEAANRAKSDFLANMSHEIRTPLNAVLGFTEILKVRLTDAHHLHYLESIHYSGKSLLNLINDILDLSKVEAGKLALEYSAISPHDLFDELKIIFSHRLQEKGLEFVIDIDPNLPKILYLDETRLRQVLINLVGNAIKFTKVGFVKIIVEVENRCFENDERIDLIITVEDSGIGIPKQEYEKVFENFTQMTGQRNSEFSGSGLGLTISKRLLEMMNGSIAVDSEVGKGTKFTVRLDHIEVITLSTHSDELEQLNDLSQLCFKHSKILIVDDILFNREVIKGFLDGYDFELIEAENGIQAIQAAQQHQPNLILMDIKMTDMSGYEASDNIRRIDSLSMIPIIAVTASAMKSDEERMRAEFEGYLKKPFIRSELIFQLMKYLPHSIAEENNKKQQELVSIDWSREHKAKLQPLLEELIEQKKNCQRVFKQHAFDELKEFALAMEKLGEHFYYQELTHWSESLHIAVDEFDIDKIKEMPSKFNLLVNGLEKHLG